MEPVSLIIGSALGAGAVSLFGKKKTTPRKTGVRKTKAKAKPKARAKAKPKAKAKPRAKAKAKPKAKPRKKKNCK